MKQFILGGARSGKSRYAETIADNVSGESAKKVIYIATAHAGDDEMQQRIIRHREQRPAHWALVEEPLKLAEVLREYDDAENFLLVDCLTLWLSNCLMQGDDQYFSHQKNELLKAVSDVKAELLLVSNEVGQGIVPLGELSRRFVDESGWLHQRLAQVCDRVVFITAGLPQILKS
ncbi:MAG TPA: bifunctional adenosylcobinamide kinase/adenosylcobinamide-phosphate guanylyltransferase [Gammaproteobacteria bacterium]|nr:bifunctional adenosylcobinamide kinase/adenosylcobinamide-phosphate guanylyltransferase [Gammaproteobacteria bacterium]